MPISQIPERREGDYPKTGILEVYHRLLSHFGPQGWWPGETEFEIMVGAILTQNTSWKNVEKSISALKERGLLDPKNLYQVPVKRLSNIIRSSGFFKVKAERLSYLIKYLMERYKGDIERMKRVDTGKLRRELLGIKGIGPETADSILLYAFDRPVFVVDAYTRRVFSRHRYFEEGKNYEEIKKFFTKNLPVDSKTYNEYHALIVRVAKRYCRKKPLCRECPLNAKGIP